MYLFPWISIPPFRGRSQPCPRWLTITYHKYNKIELRLFPLLIKVQFFIIRYWQKLQPVTEDRMSKLCIIKQFIWNPKLIQERLHEDLFVAAGTKLSPFFFLQQAWQEVYLHFEKRLTDLYMQLDLAAKLLKNQNLGFGLTFKYLPHFESYLFDLTNINVREAFVQLRFQQMNTIERKWESEKSNPPNFQREGFLVFCSRTSLEHSLEFCGLLQIYINPSYTGENIVAHLE